jgi:hypothetical protein
MENTILISNILFAQTMIYQAPNNPGFVCREMFYLYIAVMANFYVFNKSCISEKHLPQ